MARNAVGSLIIGCLVATGVPATATTITSFTTPLNMAVLGLANSAILNSAVTIHGSEGVYSGGSIANNAPSTITGNAYTYSTGQYSGPGHLDGTLYAGAALDPNFTATYTDLTTAVNNALGNATAAAGMTATQTFGAITSATNITGNGGVNVIQINGNITNSITLHGTASDFFVINVTGTVTLNGSTGLTVTGGVDASHVLYNFTGASGNLSTQVGNTVYGTLLAPNYTFTNMDGTYVGEIIATGSIDLLSNSSITADAFTGIGAVPEPGTSALSACGAGLVLLAYLRRRSKRSSIAS